MPDRRQVLAWLGGICAGAAWAADQPVVPPFAAAQGGDAAGWRHQTLPKVESRRAPLSWPPRNLD